MFIKKRVRFSVVTVAVLLILGLLSQSILVALALPDQDSVIEGLSYEEHSLLTQTFGEPLGAFGFDDDGSENPNEIVEIAVQFVTPSAVALRLLHQEDHPRARVLNDSIFGNRALEAHDVFKGQLQELMIQPFTMEEAPSFEIFSEHYSLFNGVFMRVPRYMVAQIASLDEVFSVTPNRRVYVPEPEPELEVGTEDFMVESLELFNMDYIHNNMGFTGEGVRVAVLDTGIDYTHPRFEPYLDPATNSIRGWNLINDNSDVMDFHGHGTHVSGTVIAIAPDVELWHFQVLDEGGIGSIEQVVSGIEAAHEAEMDVVNLSIGGFAGDPLHPESVAANLAMLDGVVVVIAAGNSGDSMYTMEAPGSACLPITVASGTAGGRNNYGDTVSWWSSRGPILYTYHIKPDIVAPGDGIVSTFLDGTYYIAGGTSMAAPHVAGIAALIIQRFPDTNSYEIKARIMNTARPLEELEEPSVFTIGAGFVDPINALEMESFATVSHSIPWLDGDNQGWREKTMASMSFGLIVERSTSVPMTVTIHNPGVDEWNNVIVFNGQSAGVSLNVIDSDVSGANHTYTFQMEFAYYTWDNIYEGNVIFTNGEQNITIPFGVRYDSFVNRDMQLRPNNDHIFRTYVGYSSVREHLVRILNRGNVPLDNIGVRLVGNNPEAFELSKTSIPTIERLRESNFTVTPRIGLGVGVYEATIEVFFEINGQEEIQEFDVCLQVEADIEVEVELWARERLVDWDLMERMYLPLWQVSEYSFGSAMNYGSLQRDREAYDHTEVWIKNTGNASTGEVTISLAGENPDAFYLGDVVFYDGWGFIFWNYVREITIPNIEPGEYVLFIVALDIEFYVVTTAKVVVSAENMPTEYIDLRNVKAGLGENPELEIHVDEILDFGSVPHGFPRHSLFRVWATNIGDRAVRTIEILDDSDVVGELENNTQITNRGLLGLPIYIHPGETAILCEIMVWSDGNLPVGTYISTVTLSRRGLFTQQSFDIQLEIVEPEDRPVTLAFGENIDFGTEVVGYNFEAGWTNHDYMAQERIFNTWGEHIRDANVRIRLEGEQADSFNLICSWTQEYYVEKLVENDTLLFNDMYDFGIKPVMNLPPGIYEAKVVILVNDEALDSFDLRLEVVPAVHDIEIYPTGNHVFDRIDVDDISSPHWVSIRNTGNISTGNLNITISGDSPESFRLSRNSIRDLQRFVVPWVRDEVFFNSAYLVVTPHPDLAEGIHTATITISGDNTPSYSFDVSITVGDPQEISVNNLPDKTPLPPGQTYSQIISVGAPFPTLLEGNPGANWTFLGWTTDRAALETFLVAWDEDNPATWDDAVDTEVIVDLPTIMPSIVVRATAVWGNNDGEIGIPNNNLIIDNLPDKTPLPAGQTASQVVVVGEPLPQLVPGDSGEIWVFRGWTTDREALEEFYASWNGDVPATWADAVVAGIIVSPPTNMPEGVLTITAVWEVATTFGISYNPNAQMNGTVIGTPACLVGLQPGTHNLSPGVPTHTPVSREGVLTHVMFRGWSAVPIQIIAPEAPLPELITSVTITDANVTVYAAWEWGTCVECNECPTCEKCFDCRVLEECDCGSGYCNDCCTECCDCDFVCKDCEECCDIEECECGSGYCEECCTECAIHTFSITYNPNARGGGTVRETPETRIDLLAGIHNLSPGIPIHTPVLRDGVLTKVEFLGWSAVPTTRIFAVGDVIPELLTRVTITDTSVTVYAVWRWGTCVADCKECPTCEECFLCGYVEECNCDSDYCKECCTECDEEPPPPIRRPGPQGPPGDRGPAGPAGPAGAPGADARPVPKTGDDANMSLWIMMFALGLLGFAAVNIKLVTSKKRNTKQTMIVIKDDNDEDVILYD